MYTPARPRNCSTSPRRPRHGVHRRRLPALRADARERRRTRRRAHPRAENSGVHDRQPFEPEHQPRPDLPARARLRLRTRLRHAARTGTVGMARHARRVFLGGLRRDLLLGGSTRGSGTGNDVAGTRAPSALSLAAAQSGVSVDHQLMRGTRAQVGAGAWFSFTFTFTLHPSSFILV